MLAIDTNVVVRYLTADHPEQSAKARELIEAHEVFVGHTVLLECEWVLRSVFGFKSAEVATALRRFAGLPTVKIEAPALVARAIELALEGMDFADALHILRAADCEAFLTFDARCLRLTRRLGLDDVRPA